MLGTLPNDTKKKWQDWVPTLTHVYNCTTSKTTGFSPYAAKLEHRLKWAYEAAQKYIDKENHKVQKVL